MIKSLISLPLFTCLFVSVFSLCMQKASAENLSYMDDSGNIHFVDSVKEIPSQYQMQVLRPTPIAKDKAEYAHQMAAYNRKKQEAKTEQLRVQHEHALAIAAAKKASHQQFKHVVTHPSIDTNGPQLAIPTAAPTPIPVPQAVAPST